MSAGHDNINININNVGLLWRQLGFCFRGLLKLDHNASRPPCKQAVVAIISMREKSYPDFEVYDRADTTSDGQIILDFVNNSANRRPLFTAGLLENSSQFRVAFCRFRHLIRLSLAPG